MRQPSGGPQGVGFAGQPRACQHQQQQLLLSVFMRLRPRPGLPDTQVVMTPHPLASLHHPSLAAGTPTGQAPQRNHGHLSCAAAARMGPPLFCHRMSIGQPKDLIMSLRLGRRAANQPWPWRNAGCSVRQSRGTMCDRGFLAIAAAGKAITHCYFPDSATLLPGQ